MAHASPTIQFIDSAHDKSFTQLVQTSISNLLSFANKHHLGIKNSDIFVDKVVLYGTKLSFDQMISNSPVWPKGSEVPKNYVGLGQKKVFHVVSWKAYKKIHPDESITDYQKLITHELAHLLHISFLKDREDDMGPLWFFEGFACFVAEQYPEAVLPPKEQLNQIFSDNKRGNYSNYVAIFRRLAQKKPVFNLLQDAKSSEFLKWAKDSLQERP